MKIDLDIKNKKGKIDVDAEKLIDKKMDLHDKNWKDKFSAKKEMTILKHKQDLEVREAKLKKKSFVREIADSLNSGKQMKLEEERKKEEQKRKNKILGASIMLVGGVVAVLGNFFGEALFLIGLLAGIAGFILIIRK